MDYIKQYKDNIRKIETLKKENSNLIFSIISDYLSNHNMIFMLRNVAIDKIAFTTSNDEINKLISALTSETNFITNDINFNFQDNEFIIFFKNKEIAKEFVSKYHIKLVQNEKGKQLIEFDHVIKNYENLFEYLTV